MALMLKEHRPLFEKFRFEKFEWNFVSKTVECKLPWGMNVLVKLDLNLHINTSCISLEYFLHADYLSSEKKPVTDEELSEAH